ncbi:protein polyglycylase TTLL10 isoform X3 [Hippoglossus hippoglossus]|uniref:protein polyglycylase TTLL10 isoform X3 n=1 Tax=Hippoglossus hippoglossus TaxID=8267 RepID=UPI00148C360E|nr:protein polyglycylase TTLL10 isoform X3 [Hippoglossus hippoglossus]
MSSESWVESCTEGRGDTGLEKKQDGVQTEEVEVPCQDDQPAEPANLRQEVCSSVEHSGTQEVTSAGGLEQVQREEMQRKKFSHMSVNREGRARGSGAGSVQRCLRRSSPRGLSICSYPDKDRERHRDEPRGPGPFFFLGGTNGAEIVSSYFESRGWKRIYNKHREDFKLKWCETKSPANYCNFREGEQLLYQIPNNKVLTTKIGLLSSLREYERVSSKVSHGQGLRRLKMEEFIPITYRMDVREEREAFFAQQEAGEGNNESRMWICKPTGLNQGRGIFLLKSQEDLAALRLKLQHMDDSQADRKLHHCQAQARIVQHYIKSPLLLKGKKFDVRSYLLIACTAPYLVFFRHGYVRLTCDLYDPSSNNLSAHLTNQYMQKKNPLYSQLKEDTVWSMESFNAYINDCFGVAKGLPRDWVLGIFAHMQRIMTQCFFAVKSKLDCRLGFFDLIGCDFMVDEDFKVWLLEMNCNPALHTNCEVLREVIPSAVVEMLDLTLEIFNKCRLRQRILPLASQREFVLLYNGVFPPDSRPACNKNDTNSETLQKTTNKTQKAEPRRCKSGLEGKNVSESGAGRGSSKSGHHPTSSSSSAQRASHPHSSNYSTQSVRSKTLKPQLQLKLSKCTLHHHLKATGDVKTQVIMSPSSSELIEGVSVCGSQKTTQCAPLSGLPECVNKCERGEEPGEEKLGEDTKSLVLE